MYVYIYMMSYRIKIINHSIWVVQGQMFLDQVALFRAPASGRGTFICPHFL